VATTRAWLQSASGVDCVQSLTAQVASSGLNLPTLVPSTEDDPSFALLLPGRRKAKALQKEAHAQKLLATGSKPAHVSKRTGVSVQRCYQIVAAASRQSVDPSRSVRPRVGDDRLLISEVKRYIDSATARQFCVSDMRRELLTVPGLYVPSYSVLRQIVIKKFGLTFRAPRATNSKYTDPAFDMERLWASRVLASMLSEEVCLVSVDESNFKQKEPRRFWQSSLKQQPATEHHASGVSLGCRQRRKQSTPWSFNVIGAMTMEHVVGLWVIEGTTNHQVFLFFIQTVVTALLKSEATKGKRIVIQIDNARVHENPATAEAMTRLGVSVIFNARYSPMLNSIEMLWHECKRRLKKRPPVTEKQAFVS
jgi:hypothetical protein